jgi:hypothetical protein
MTNGGTMRRLLTQLFAVMFIWCLAGAPPALAAAQVQIRIEATTSAIFQYDGYPVPAGETWPAVRVTGAVKKCEGNYAFWATLTQDGVQAEPAMYGAMGWATYTCGQGLKSVNFASPNLHPGRATVTFYVGNSSTTRVVRIPG